VIHVSQTFQVGVSHERSQLCRVWFTPDHSLLKQEIVVLDLLFRARDRVWGLDVLFGCTEISDDDWFVPNRRFDRAHARAFAVTEIHVAVTRVVNHVQLPIAQDTVDDLDVFVLDRHVLVTRRFHQKTRVRKLQIQLDERPKNLEKILPVVVSNVPDVIEHVRSLRNVHG
jgi:hypothetical protein